LIGSNGLVLSGGQKQMIGLARAFYGDVKLLVLDEPNANLDGNSEASLINALLYAKKSGITTFIMTHKVQLLNAVDKILVMTDGMISGIGPRDEILSKIVPKYSPQNTQSQGQTRPLPDNVENPKN
ncbi:type I secretion system ATPase, partial [Ehrlichia ruminantium]